MDKKPREAFLLFLSDSEIQKSMKVKDDLRIALR